MQKVWNRLLLVLFGLVMAAAPILTFVMPEKTVSYFENRALAKKPVATRESILSGQYFADWDAYLGDHIVGLSLIHI